MNIFKKIIEKFESIVWSDALKKLENDDIVLEEITIPDIRYEAKHDKKSEKPSYVEKYKEALDDKVEEFINWYEFDKVKGSHTKLGEYREPIKIRNFIEKMATWYELRYPDQFIENNQDLEIETNTIPFIDSLSESEKYYISDANYRMCVCLNGFRNTAYFNLTKDGYVKEVINLDKVIAEINPNEKVDKLEGMHIKEVQKILKNKNLIINKDELQEEIDKCDNWNYIKEEVLNCVMYRIIERGGNRIGPRRALMFAKEFNTNIDIPMMYGVDMTDPNLRYLISSYIKLGGNKNLNCFKNYFAKENKYDKMEMIRIWEILNNSNYTDFENNLHDKLITTLSKYSNEKEKKETIQQLRLQRRLEKSLNRKKR